MRIGFSASLYDGGLSGIGRYIGALLEQLALHPDGMEYVVFRPAADVGRLPEGASLRYVRLPAGVNVRSPVRDLLWHHLFVQRAARRWQLDCLHFPTSRRLAFRVPCPTVVTVHDLASLHVREKLDRRRTLYHTRVIPFLLRSHDRIVSVSEATTADLVRVGIPQARIHTVAQGIDHQVYFPRPKPAALALARERFGIVPPFLLYVARLEHPAKNHVRLLRAFRHVLASHPELHLVLAGAEWFGQDAIYRVVDELGLRERVRFTGFVEEPDLPALYSAAEALVFPSLHEGFGLPLLEAMACGTAVVASDVASIPELVGDCGVLVDPWSEEDVARGILEILEDRRRGERALRGRERAAGFSWRRTARETQDAYRAAVTPVPPGRANGSNPGAAVRGSGTSGASRS